MEYLAVSLTALFTAGLTFFSGFGLGTLLLPVFAIFFQIDVAVTLTAVVHLLNNLFKLVLVGRHVDKSIALKFGVPAILAAYLGAKALVWISDLQPLLEYQLAGQNQRITPVNATIAALLLLFAITELLPRFKDFSFDRKYLPVGGILSGFFGGLAGNQGALRSAILVKSGMTKESFIATGAVIASAVDISRLVVYGSHFSSDIIRANGTLLLMATLSAFTGAFFGNRLVKKTTIHAIQVIVAIMLLVLAVGLGTGVI